MRHAVAFTLVALYGLPAFAVRPSSLTVIVDSEQVISDSALEPMARELERLLSPAGLHTTIKLRSDLAAGESFEDLVVVTMKGNCMAEQDPMLLDERGPAPLAYAHASGIEILPFTAIDCDHLRRAVATALRGAQSERDAQFGLALGRVLAHEIFHIVENTRVHSKSVVFRSSLKGTELVSKKLDFTPADLERLRKAVAPQPGM